MTVVQMSSSIPLILYAETFEEAGGNDGSAPGQAEAHNPVDEAEPHDGAEAWAPDDGLERTFWTMITNDLLGFGAGLVLAAGLVLHKLAPHGSVHALVGLAWGRAAFLAFGLAPVCRRSFRVQPRPSWKHARFGGSAPPWPRPRDWR